MVGYRWTCNACSASNSEDIDICSSCGCSATASSDEIDRHLDPEGYKKKAAKKRFDKKLNALLFLPFLLIGFAVSGRAELLLCSIVFFGISIKSNMNLLKEIKNDSWYKKALLGSSLYLLIFMASRPFLNVNSETIGWYILAWVLSLTVIYVLLFKSEKAKKFFERYYQKYDS